MKSVAFVICLAAACCSSSVHAQFSTPLRCDNNLAQVRDTKAAVIHKCGQPFFVEMFCVPHDRDLAIIPMLPNVPFISPVPCRVVEEWSYNPGPGQLIAIFRFEQGAVTSIRYGDRVW